MNLTQSFESARTLAKKNAKSFYFSSFALPPVKRQGAYAIYAFCRQADDAVDQGFNTNAELEIFRHFLDAIYLKVPLAAQPPWFLAFQKTAEDYQIPREFFDDLLTGLTLDLDFKQPQSIEDLLDYCYYVAGCVGLMMTSIFGLSAPRLQEAQALGQAMQLTNIIRDIREDARLERVYIPVEILERNRVSTQDVLSLASPWATLSQAQKVWPALKELATLAKISYAQAQLGIPFLTPDGSQFCVQLMAATYEQILDLVMARGPAGVFERTSTTLLQKISQIPFALANASRQNLF